MFNEYCEENQINCDKTKIVIFAKASAAHQQFTLKDTPLEITREYRNCAHRLWFLQKSYLNVSKSIKEIIICKTSTQLHYPKPALLCHLFNSLVCPVTEYGSEVWGFNQAEDIERVHRHFCKYVLGVPRIYRESSSSLL